MAHNVAVSDTTAITHMAKIGVLIYFSFILQFTFPMGFIQS